MRKLHISQNGEPPFQYEEADVESMFRQGRFQEDAIYWKEGMSDWQPLRGLFPPVPSPPPLVPQSSSSRPVTDSPYAPPAVNPVPAPAAPLPGRYAFSKDPRRLTKVLKLMLWLHALVALLSILSDFGQLALVNGGYFSPEEATANDARQRLVGLLRVGVYFSTVVVFAMWVYRANKNCRGFGAARMEFTPGWAVGYYFIPILHLFRPFQSMKEIWKVSSNPRHWPTETVPALVGWWWGLWIVANVMGNIVVRLNMAADDVDSLRIATQISIVSSVVDVALVIAAVTVISRILAMQLRLIEEPA